MNLHNLLWNIWIFIIYWSKKNLQDVKQEKQYKKIYSARTWASYLGLNWTSSHLFIEQDLVLARVALLHKN